MSAAHFQFPSVCFSQTSRYFPRSLIGLPLASFIVNSYVPLTHRHLAGLADLHSGRLPSDDEAGTGEHVFPDDFESPPSSLRSSRLEEARSRHPNR